MQPAEFFTQLVLSGKLSMILLLMIFSVINGHVEYVEKKPRLFITDAILTGLTGAIVAVFLAFTRGRPDLWMNHAIFALLFFFFFHVSREFMGYFSILGNRPVTNKSLEIQYNVLKYPITIVVGLFILAFVGLAIMEHDMPVFKGGILGNFSAPSAFAIETLVVSLVLGIGEIIVLYNHGERRLSKLLESIAVFLATHLVLQFGGFYKTIYSGKVNIPPI